MTFYTNFHEWIYRGKNRLIFYDKSLFLTNIINHEISVIATSQH